MKVLLTGATGYLGQVLLPKLLEVGHTVRVLARASSDVSSIKELKNVEIFTGDIIQENSLKGIEKDIDCAYHLAVLAPSDEIKNDQIYYDVNERGSINLLKQFVNSNLKKFLFTTSSAALGAISHKVITEEDFSQPITVYGKSKYHAELSIKKFADQNAIPLVLVRLTHVYGPGETRDLYRMVKMIKKGIFPQVGFSANLWPAVYIDDAVQGLMCTMENGREGQTYIITDKTSHDTKMIRNYVRKHLGLKDGLYPFLPKYLSLALFSLRDFISDKTGKKLPVTKKNIQYMSAGRIFSISKAKNELGYDPQITLEEGLKRMLKLRVLESPMTAI